MNHYELVFIVNPQLSKDSKLFDKCKEQITSINGILHRAEDIGLRDLAYQIDDCSKGHYFLLNFDCPPNYLNEIESLFKYPFLKLDLNCMRLLNIDWNCLMDIFLPG